MGKISNTQKGKIGENIATDYLIKNQYVIEEKNYRFGRFEIDIIAKKNDILHFVEVKYRKSIAFGYPEQSVSKSKMNQIKAAAENYIFDLQWDKNIQFDIIAIIETNKNNIEILHFEDAF